MRLNSSIVTVGRAVAVFAQLAAAGKNVIDLSKQKWTLTSPNFNNISVPGKVPSHAHVDLYEANIISDPYVSILHLQEQTPVRILTQRLQFN